ncbi:MAG: hypothetical protein NC097_06565 [Clostridium sp.]|nr:hypothetical protein [Prevotella sp.]MCM1429443.1 hypothetical protein [Clostridium sp.]MCM1475522.1 hypothetical protein [Muribaculaceae bacterium]
MSLTKRLTIAVAAVALGSFPGILMAQRRDSVPTGVTIADRWILHSGLWTQKMPEIYDNPAFTPMRHGYSLGEVRASFYRDHQSRAVNPQEGCGEGMASLEAEAYIHSGNSTLTGRAGYTNGTVFDLQWNESGDYNRVYPYVIADAVGGNIHRETYSFTGGYSHFKGRLSWGLDGGYDANLSYRKVDPRPKTIAGTLHIRGGIAYNLWKGYMLGLSADFEKYRQSTDISFVSELGESKLYHLTGLGTQYARFAGEGTNVYNDSYICGGGLYIFRPADSGVFAICKYHRMTLSHVIVDINKLPMATLWQNSIDAEAGWRHTGRSCRWTALANISWLRRHGSENIFGDPTSGSYPEIGSLELYAHNYYDIHVRALGEWLLGRHIVDGSIEGGYSHSRQDYMVPRRKWLVDSEYIRLNAGYSCKLSRKGALRAELNAERRLNVKSTLEMGMLSTDDEIRSLEESVIQAFSSSQATMTLLGADLAGIYTLSPKYALGFDLKFRHMRYGNGIRRNIFQTSITFNF